MQNTDQPLKQWLKHPGVHPDRDRLRAHEMRDVHIARYCDTDQAHINQVLNGGARGSQELRDKITELADRLDAEAAGDRADHKVEVVPQPVASPAKKSASRAGKVMAFCKNKLAQILK